MKRNENFWSYILRKLGTPKVLRTDGQTDGRHIFIGEQSLGKVRIKGMKTFGVTDYTNLIPLLLRTD